MYNPSRIPINGVIFMAVVRDDTIGRTHVVICDDYCVSPEEAEKILDRIADRVFPTLIKQIREKDKDKGE